MEKLLRLFRRRKEISHSAEPPFETSRVAVRAIIDGFVSEDPDVAQHEEAVVRQRIQQATVTDKLQQPYWQSQIETFVLASRMRAEELFQKAEASHSEPLADTYSYLLQTMDSDGVERGKTDEAGWQKLGDYEVRAWSSHSR